MESAIAEHNVSEAKALIKQTDSKDDLTKAKKAVDKAIKKYKAERKEEESKQIDIYGSSKKWYATYASTRFSDETAKVLMKLKDIEEAIKTKKKELSKKKGGRKTRKASKKGTRKTRRA